MRWYHYIAYLFGGAFLANAVPHFTATVNASWFDVPLVLFEMALGLWLLFKGLSESTQASAA
jgi:hypothetical protein